MGTGWHSAPRHRAALYSDRFGGHLRLHREHSDCRRVPGPTVSGVNFIPGYYGFFYYAVPYQFATQAFAQPAAGTLGNLGRNSVWGPGFTNYDLALSRSFVFVEQTCTHVPRGSIQPDQLPSFRSAHR